MGEQDLCSEVSYRQCQTMLFCKALGGCIIYLKVYGVPDWEIWITAPVSYSCKMLKPAHRPAFCVLCLPLCRQDSPAHRPSATTFCALISALRDAARALPQADISGRKALGRRMVAVRNLMRVGRSVHDHAESEPYSHQISSSCFCYRMLGEPVSA
jgi:hypothetical protein